MRLFNKSNNYYIYIFLVDVLIKDEKDLLYETVSINLEPDQKWYELKLKSREINVKNVGTIKGIGDVYLDGVKIKEEDIIPNNITSKNTIKAMCSFVKLGVLYIILLIFFDS
jgi:hypothetical protein